MISSSLTAKRNLFISLFLLFVATQISSVGFYVIGGREPLEAIYTTVVIFTTIGDIDTEFSDAERIWALLVMVFGLGLVLYAFGNVMAVITGDEVRRMLGRRQVYGKIKSLENHYIVCGFGRMGRNICRQLAREGCQIVLIESDTERTTEAEELGYLYIVGDATDEMVLKKAGIDVAKGLVSVLGHDANNVFVTLTARGLNDSLTIITRTEEEATEMRLLRAGATRAVNPQRIGAQLVTRMLLHPALLDFMDATRESEMEVDRISVSKLPEMVGKSLKELGLPKDYGLMVLAVVNSDDENQFNPDLDYILSEGEQLIVMGPKQGVENIMETYGE